jgi:hypothetical protein
MGKSLVSWSLALDATGRKLHNDAEIEPAIIALGHEPGGGLKYISKGCSLASRRINKLFDGVPYEDYTSGLVKWCCGDCRDGEAP